MFGMRTSRPAHQRKFERYQAAVEEWGPQGICLQPLVRSTEGRAHPDVARVMSFCAKALAQRKGVSAGGVLQRWRADVGVALAVRRARMARRCLPPSSARSGYVTDGVLGDDEGGRVAAEGILGAYVADTEEPYDAVEAAAPEPPTLGLWLEAAASSDHKAQANRTT